MYFKRMVMEKESPEEIGYDNIRYNLSESSIMDKRLSEIGIHLDDLLLHYGSHGGVQELKEIIGNSHYGLNAENVLVCSGACMALFVINATILSPKDSVLVIQPNYATNIEVPRSLDINIDLIKLSFDDGFRLDLDEVKSRVHSGTKLISVTYPHNPSGVMISRDELDELVRIAEQHDCYLLVDETYRELTFGEKLPTAASLSSKAVSVESVSKSYGVPGIRIGWLASQDLELMERFLATKEQIIICNSIVDEHIALEVLKKKQELLEETNKKNHKNFQLLKNWMADQSVFEWVEPAGGVVCLARFRPEIEIDTSKFYNTLFDDYRTFVGPGRWFDQSDRYFRIGYGWPTTDDLAAGLEGLQSAARDTVSQ
ncbi:aminotransferase class I/II-fold pyridoxal phosphate-dependent enzyme [Kineobactrum salinum]|uniref:Aminotransferase n=1 Tax=Kineobactrum salinum TaxID=2708301 RepID=A0A6C0U4X1_9GAMM|nr:aminotransferase class I/II-fold pyridoxal phosphate-dependent enzyme [Kineobactrum salinum]QIB65445.1 aminotransferase class I/II-fold pyridoxal phosphate-dependent enzyme [Kineobactrum salinum]